MINQHSRLPTASCGGLNFGDQNYVVTAVFADKALNEAFLGKRRFDPRYAAGLEIQRDEQVDNGI
jgi:hypothetical protein